MAKTLAASRRDQPDVVETAVSAAWPGQVMGSTRIAGARVRPVVQVLPAAAERLRRGAGPELDRSTLALWESWPADKGAQPPAPAVRIVGFIAEGPWRQAVSTATLLCGYGASLLVRRATPARVRLAEADYHGITVVVVNANDRPSMVVRGRTGPVGGAQRTVALRHLEEVVFEAAISSGLLETPSLATTGSST